MISLGGTNFSSLYYGSTKIGEAYFGSDLVYQQDKRPLTDTYTLLWSGDARTNIVLASAYTNFDALIFQTYQQTIKVPVPTLVSANGIIDITIPTDKYDSTPYFSLRAQHFKFSDDGLSGNAISSHCKAWYPNSGWSNNTYFFNWQKIYGVNYATT